MNFDQFKSNPSLKERKNNSLELTQSFRPKNKYYQQPFRIEENNDLEYKSELSLREEDEENEIIITCTWNDIFHQHNVNRINSMKKIIQILRDETENKYKYILNVTNFEVYGFDDEDEDEEQKEIYLTFDKPYLTFSEEVFNALMELKDWNYKYIYLT